MNMGLMKVDWCGWSRGKICVLFLILVILVSTLGY